MKTASFSPLLCVNHVAKLALLTHSPVFFHFVTIYLERLCARQKCDEIKWKNVEWAWILFLTPSSILPTTANLAVAGSQCVGSYSYHYCYFYYHYQTFKTFPFRNLRKGSFLNTLFSSIQELLKFHKGFQEPLIISQFSEEFHDLLGKNMFLKKKTRTCLPKTYVSLSKNVFI